jgi:hypothetical protein
MTMSDETRSALGVQDFADWIATAVAGRRVVYFEGDLAYERSREQRDATKAISEGRSFSLAANDVAKFAWEQQEAGTIRLVQRRRNPDAEISNYDYIAVRTDNRAASSRGNRGDGAAPNISMS